MAKWLNQLQSLLGQSRSSTSSSADQGLGKLLVPGALGGLAGLLVANKSARPYLARISLNNGLPPRLFAHLLSRYTFSDILIRYATGTKNGY